MSQQGAALQSYNNELVKCKFLCCNVCISNDRESTISIRYAASE